MSKKQQKFPNRLTVEKIIYAKRIPVTKDQMEGVFILEIEHHLRQHPDLEFDSISSPVENADRSRSYYIEFRYKRNAIEADVAVR
jgi:hypothetical protein